MLGTDYIRRVYKHGAKKIKPFMKEYVEYDCDDEGRDRMLLLEWEAKGVVQGPEKFVSRIRNVT